MYKLLVDHVKKYEGCKLEAYLCPAGVWTIGYGCTGKDIVQGVKWTPEKATEQLCFRLYATLTDITKVSPRLLTASYSKQAAIASFVYNCGLQAYIKSTLKKEVDAGDWEEAAVQIKRWNKGGGKVLPGLVKRREAEAQMLLEDIAGDAQLVVNELEN